MPDSQHKRHQQLSMGKLQKTNQEEEYRKMMGEEAYARQKKLADLAVKTWPLSV